MKKILVVDDEKPISDIIKFNLTKEGYDVHTAYDGEEALKQVEEVSPDLIILAFKLRGRHFAHGKGQVLFAVLKGKNLVSVHEELLIRGQG